MKFHRKNRAMVGALLLVGLSGCHQFPFTGRFRADAKVDADARVVADAAVRGSIEVKVATAPDPGPMTAVVVRPSHSGSNGLRIGLIDVDGLLVNQNLTGLYSVGENPVSSFREKLEAAANDPGVRALVVRINSPGGGVTASDIMADELRRFREESGKPVVCCLMDVATSGAYYLAVGGDRVVGLPTGLTGSIGALINHYNLQDAMAQLNLSSDPIKSGDKLDMGSVTAPLDEETRELLQELSDGFRTRFRDRVASRRPAITAVDWKTIDDGRVVSNPKALAFHMIDQLGYVHEAIAEAERLGQAPGSEVVIFQRPGYPTRSIYSITPNAPIQGDIVPFSYPGLDRSKAPTFLYLWQPDPTIFRQAGR
ncbi:S49 family peptidase [Tundrisphaera lichenicola]|uniref:S49 family peptidase n=1 Tax=Tundrisphaera lichenicola TaxID=2029860 RepID=UPI003EBD45A7